MQQPHTSQSIKIKALFPNKEGNEIFHLNSFTVGHWGGVGRTVPGNKITRNIVTNQTLLYIGQKGCMLEIVRHAYIKVSDSDEMKTGFSIEVSIKEPDEKRFRRLDFFKGHSLRDIQYADPGSPLAPLVNCLNHCLGPIEFRNKIGTVQGDSATFTSKGLNCPEQLKRYIDNEVDKLQPLVREPRETTPKESEKTIDNAPACPELNCI